MPKATLDHNRFDWSAEAAATKHGFSAQQIQAAFEDPRRVIKRPATANRKGERYAEDGRRVMLAQPKPNGPYLQIAFVTERDRIRPFHCQQMSQKEVQEYKGKK